MKTPTHFAGARGRRSSRALRNLTGAALFALAVPLAFAASDSKASKYYEDALTRYEKKDIPGAILQLKNALQADKNNLSVQVLLGKALLANSEVAAAEVAFTEALRLGVNRAEVVVPLARAVVAQGKQQDVVEQQRFQTNGLSSLVRAELLLIKAAAYADLGDPRAALKTVDEARAADPDSMDVWLAEVPIRIRARQFKEALAAVAKARSIKPDSADVHYQQASILHVQGDKAGALAAYDKALQADPENVDARVARAGMHLDEKRNEAAAKDVAELLAKRPLEPRGWYLSALLAEREGKQQQVRNSLVKINELLDPVPIEYMRYRPQVLLLGGQAHYGLGEREKAKPLFEAFQRAQPGTPVSKLLANIYLAEQNYDRAVESLEQYLRAFPNDSQAMALLASAHMAKGRHARAASLMQDALRSKDAPELYTAYGLSLMGAGQTTNAVTQLEIAYKKDPGQTQAAYALVGLYLRDNQSAKALTIANALTTRQPLNPSYQNLLGMAKAQARDTNGARAAFEQAMKLDSTLSQANMNLARLEMGAKNLDRAQSLLDGVLKTEERNTEAMYLQAELASRRGKPADALRWLEKAYDVAGAKDLRSALALVDLHMRQGRPADALKIAQQVSAYLPDDLAVLMALVRAQLANNDQPNAKATLTTATRLANFDAAVQVEIAVLQLTVRNPSGAAYSLEKALSTRPDFLPALVMMTEVETKQGEFAKAETRAQQILKKEPKLAIGNSLMGDISMARNQPKVAIDYYKKAFQAEPSPDTAGRLFRTQASLDVKAAVQLMDQWLQKNPNDIDGRRMLAEAHVKSNNMASAKQEYERLRQLAPKDIGVINDLANVMLRMKDPQAMQVAEQALAADPNNVAAIDTVGWAAFNAGNLDRAVQLLRDARLRDPDSAEIRYHLAAALVKTGRKVEAREELQVALRGKAVFEGREDAETLFRTLR